MKKVKNLYKMLKIFCHHNPLQLSVHYPEIILGKKRSYYVSNKTNSIKIGSQLYNLWQIDGHQLS